MTWYVVDYTEEVLTEIYLGSGDRAAETGKPPMPTALTLVGVSALWKAGLLVEISATAVIRASARTRGSANRCSGAGRPLSREVAAAGTGWCALRSLRSQDGA